MGLPVPGGRSARPARSSAGSNARHRGHHEMRARSQLKASHSHGHLRRDPAGGRHRHRCHQLREGVERRRLRGATGGGAVPCMACRPGRPAPESRPRRPGRPGRAGRGGQCGPADRLPGSGRRQARGLRRHQRGRPRGPLWAALTPRLAQALGHRFGLLQPVLYSGVTPGTGVAGFNDITRGNNGAYSAGPGWDACTGLGSPSATALLARLKGFRAAPQGRPPHGQQRMIAGPEPHHRRFPARGRPGAGPRGVRRGSRPTGLSAVRRSGRPTGLPAVRRAVRRGGQRAVRLAGSRVGTCRQDEARMSTNEPTIDAVSGSFSTITPSATATAGFT